MQVTMDDNIVVNVFGPHDGVYFAMTVVYKDISVDAVDAYMAQTFNAMIQFGVATGGEKMINLVHMLATENSHFTFVERYDYRTNKPSKEEVLHLCRSVLDNIPVDESPINFLVDYDTAKPIQYYGRASAVKTDPKRLSDSIKSVFTDFPNCSIGYIMTKKSNPK